MPDIALALTTTLYELLHQRAARALQGERAPQSVHPSELLHEAWLRLSRNGPIAVDRQHFCALGAREMRRILIERARARRRRPGELGEEAPAPLVETGGVTGADDVLALDRALAALAERAPEKAEIVELRFFGGLTLSEIARLKGVSRRTVDRAWKFARTWLYRELT